jgi:hypothetical protein
MPLVLGFSHHVLDRRHWKRVAIAAALCSLLLAGSGSAAGPNEIGVYKVLPPIVRGNLAIFPVIGGESHDTSQFLTLDEGVRSGQVTITEAGDPRGIVRPVSPSHCDSRVLR